MLLFLGFGDIARILNSHLAGNKSKENERVDFALILGFNPLIRIKRTLGAITKRNTGGDLAGQIIHLETGDGGKSVISGKQGRPVVVKPNPKRAYNAHTGDDDASHRQKRGAVSPDHLISWRFQKENRPHP